MEYSKYKIQINRILKIVKRFYNSEILKPSALSLDYCVCEKTIRRDFKTIREVIPLKNQHGIYSFDRSNLTNHTENLQTRLLSAFASNAEIMIECFDEKNLNQDNITFAMDYHHLPKKLAEEVMNAIDGGYKVEFIYKKPQQSSRRVVSPIKLYNSKERWYLIAKDDKDNKIKTFYFGKIFALVLLEDRSNTLTQKDIKEASEKRSIWSDSSKKEKLIKIYVKPKIAEYILDGKLHKSQKIVDHHFDGGLEVHYKITHKLEILPRIMSYFPYIYILEPKWLKDELMKDMEEYLQNLDEMDI